MLNSYIWNTYWEANKERFIEPVTSFLETGKDENLSELLVDLHKNFCNDPRITQYIELDIKEAFEEIKKIKVIPIDANMKDLDGEDLNDYLYAFLVLNFDDIYEPYYLLSNITYYSIIMTRFSFGDFVPWLFQNQFHIFKMICDEFDIYIPDIPPQGEKEERWFYYGTLSVALQDFMIDNNLTIPELWAFLYDFAPKVVSANKSTSQSLPEPQSCFLVGANKGKNGDQEFLEEALNDDKSISYWQVREYADIGDIVLIYMLSPKSAFCYKGRVLSKPIIDPFYPHYYSSIIGHIKKIPTLTLKEIKNDTILKDMPIVRKNMQGINGTRIDSVYYNRLRELLDKSNLPELSNEIPIAVDLQLQNENDVEEKLINPFLKELGIKESDYIRQFRAQVGRKDAVIPDYVVYPSKTNKRGYESCKMVVEAKYIISSENDLINSRGQLISYARRLNAPIAILASNSQIFLYQSQDDYDDVIIYSWNDLQNNDEVVADAKLNMYQ